MYFYIPVSGQPQLLTPFSHPEGVPGLEISFLDN